MNISKKIKAIVVTGVLTLALATPLFTPVGNVVPGSSVISTQAKAGKLSIKQAKKKLKNKIKADGRKTSYTFEYEGKEEYNDGNYYVFFIYKCNGSQCAPRGYGEVNVKTGKARYSFGSKIPDWM